MPTMGNYCKAYPTSRFQEFEGWNASARNAAAVVENNNGNKDAVLNYLFLQENFVVTEGVFKDERIVFDTVTDEWVDFCKTVLQFEVPVYERIEFKDPVNNEDNRNKN